MKGNITHTHIHKAKLISTSVIYKEHGTIDKRILQIAKLKSVLNIML